MLGSPRGIGWKLKQSSGEGFILSLLYQKHQGERAWCAFCFWSRNKRYSNRRGRGGDIAPYFRFAKWLSHAVKENMTVFGELTSPEKSLQKIASAQRHVVVRDLWAGFTFPAQL